MYFKLVTFISLLLTIITVNAGPYSNASKDDINNMLNEIGKKTNATLPMKFENDWEWWYTSGGNMRIEHYYKVGSNYSEKESKLYSMMITKACSDEFVGELMKAGVVIEYNYTRGKDMHAILQRFEISNKLCN